jgi:hypothetical protein
MDDIGINTAIVQLQQSNRDHFQTLSIVFDNITSMLLTIKLLKEKTEILEKRVKELENKND